MEVKSSEMGLGWVGLEAEMRAASEATVARSAETHCQPDQSMHYGEVAMGRSHFSHSRLFKGKMSFSLSNSLSFA